MLTQPLIQTCTLPGRARRFRPGSRALAFCLSLSLLLHGAGMALWRTGMRPSVAGPVRGAGAPLRLSLAGPRRAAPAPPPMPARAMPAPALAGASTSTSVSALPRRRARPAAPAAPTGPGTRTVAAIGGAPALPAGSPEAAPIAAPAADAAATPAASAAADAAATPAAGAAANAAATPASDAAAPGPAASAAILAAARREAAATARALNRARGAEGEFRAGLRAELDRQFDAAHAAGGGWFRSARIEEITRASDGNARVYRIVTPFGAFCRLYPANGGAPMNMLCPR